MWAEKNKVFFFCMSYHSNTIFYGTCTRYVKSGFSHNECRRHDVGADDGNTVVVVPPRVRYYFPAIDDDVLAYTA